MTAGLACPLIEVFDPCIKQKNNFRDKRQFTCLLSVCL